MATRPKAVVLSCRGGHQGDLGVVRTLGRQAVPVVLAAESRKSPARHSRYAAEFLHLPVFTRDPEGAVERLVAFGKTEPTPPVLFPTADPDLTLISRFRDELAPYFRLVVASRELVEAFSDKGLFHHIARENAFPVPETHRPGSREDVEALAGTIQFPVILKPTIPQRWTLPAIQELVQGKKAVVAEDAESLVSLYGSIAHHEPGMVIQEYIPGRDDRLYSLHIYQDAELGTLGAFTGQKIRTYPTYAGIGCYVRSIHLPELIQAGSEMLRRVGYSGLALLQFKKDERDGSFRLLEINPRASSWNLLAYGCGVNLPYIAYRRALGEPVRPAPDQAAGVQYIYFENDLRAFLDYRRDGEWAWGSWARSLVGRNVYQHFATDDPLPFFLDSWRLVRSLGGRFRP